MLDETCEFEEPEKFMPERFIKDGKIGTPDSFLPFGFGRHRCMGETLARANIFILTSSLLQHFNLRLVPGDPAPSTDGIDGVTPGPCPFRALITLRE